ncbi:ring finger domain containing protein [Nitzschia inconspicua]|uniref:Ring finger domain containing protein n=1 Tax=Nitzschia inconspicua TaxID=303405 RepID=A0A9K3LVY3_9STRA|nr:ring finger domain containing protein [Nitzschia inconspicua]
MKGQIPAMKLLRHVYQNPMFEVLFYVAMMTHFYANYHTLQSRSKVAKLHHKKMNDDRSNKTKTTNHHGDYELKGHRIAGYSLSLLVVAHVLAVRLVPLIYFDNPQDFDYSFAARAIILFPYRSFTIYYVLLGMAGGWHLIYGGGSIGENLVRFAQDDFLEQKPVELAMTSMVDSQMTAANWSSSFPPMLKLRLRCCPTKKTSTQSMASSSDSMFLFDSMECLICTDGFSNDDMVCSLNCCSNKGGRLYHSECLKEWWRKNPSCPLCRQVVATTTLPSSIIGTASYFFDRRTTAPKKNILHEPNFNLILRRVLRARDEHSNLGGSNIHTKIGSPPSRRKHFPSWTELASTEWGRDDVEEYFRTVRTRPTNTTNGPHETY